MQVLQAMGVIPRIICIIRNILMIQIFEYFELNNNALLVMRGGFELNTIAMQVMGVFESRQTTLTSQGLDMQVHASFQIFQIFFDIRPCYMQTTHDQGVPSLIPARVKHIFPYARWM